MNVEDWLSQTVAAWITLGIGAIMLVLIGCLIGLSVKLNRLRKQYLHVMNGGSAENIEDLLAQINTRLDGVTEAGQQQQNRLAQMEAIQKKMKAKIGIHRYNAFGDRGSDLSFSVAIVDESQDGVVLTGIHTRDESYMYAKPVDKGQSTYMLSPEEKEAINRSSGS